MMKSMNIQKKHQELQNKHGERQIETVQNEIVHDEKAVCEKKFYKTPWFWICITIMIMCLTRPFNIFVCGNNNGNNSGNTKD